MSKSVVDVFELVDVEKQQCYTPPAPLSAGKHAGQFFLEAMTVEQPGERVALREVKDLIRGLALARDVLEQPQITHDLPRRVAHRVTDASNKAPVGHFDLRRRRGFAFVGQPHEVLQRFAATAYALGR